MAHDAAHKSQSVLGSIALALVIVGAINWGLVGLFNFNLVSVIFGETSLVTRVVYILVGLAGLYALSLYPRVSKAPQVTHDVNQGYAPGHPDFVERRRTQQAMPR